jgi:chromosome segregation ATPase
MVKKNSNEELTTDLKNLESKIKTLEKFMNDEKKQKDMRVEKLETTSKEFDNLIKSTNLEVKGLSTVFEEKLDEQDDLLQQTIGEFNSFKELMEKELEKAAEKDELLEKLRNQVKEKDILIKEKDSTLKNKEKELKDTVNQLAKIKADYEALQTKFDQTKTLEKELKQKLGSVEKEYTEFKSKEEPVMAQNDSIRRILQSNDQGKIYLAIVEAHPNSITLDDLSDLTGLTAVLVKSSLNSLEELDVIEFNPATREIKLPND